MTEIHARTGPERALTILLRLIGTSSLTALLFVVAPRGWMIAIHRGLDLGPMPEEAIVWYLARSLSAMYALFGGLFWLLSMNPRRYRAVLIYLGLGFSAFGLLLLGIDLEAGLPSWWTYWESPFVTGFGVAISVLARRLPRE